MTERFMDPIPVPEQAIHGRPYLQLITVGPPPGVSDEQCGTVQSLAGQGPDGYPMYCDYWRPSPEQLEELQNGGFIEFIQYAPQMAMHAVNIWPAPREK